MTTPSTRSAKISQAVKDGLPYHIWVLMTAHAPEGRNGKTIVTYDPDVEPFHNEARERTALGMEYKYVEFIQKIKPNRVRDRV